ncbi:MAG: hypothetical protein DRN04_07515 [Thermoprotei archaeon]|nr:MAG: hypothetical protein DRN04_07515 [Thermoprotei archaeon]
MMNRITLAFILAATSPFILVFSAEAFYLTLLVAYILAFPFLYTLLKEKLVGYEIPDYKYVDYIFMRKIPRGKTIDYEVGIVLKLTTTAGALERVSHLNFAEEANTVLDVITSKSPTIVIKGGTLDYYIVLTHRSNNLQEAVEALKKKVASLKRELLTSSFEVIPIRFEEYLEIFPFKEKKKDWKKAALAALLPPVLWFIKLYFFSILAFLLTYPVLVEFIKKRNEKLYDFPGTWYSVEEIHSVKYTRAGLYMYTQVIRNAISSTTAENTFIVIKVEPAQTKEQAALEKSAQRKYIIGDMFNKPKTILEALRELERTQRRYGDIEEALLKVSIYTNNKTIARKMSSLLGFSVSLLPVKSPVLSKLFYKKSVLEYDTGLRYCYTLDLAFFSPYLCKRYMWEKGIVLGTDEGGNVVRLNLAALPNAHGIYVGGSGTGKSIMFKNIITQLSLYYNANFCILDITGEYRDFIELFGGIVVDCTKPFFCFRHLLLNPIKREYLLDVIAEVYRLSDMHKAILRKILSESKSFTEAAQKLPLILNELEAPLRRLDGNVHVSELLSKNIPFVMYFRREERRIAALQLMLLLDEIEDYFMAKGIVHEPRFFVFIDEAHNILDRVPDRVLQKIKESRKWGLAVICCSQEVTAFKERFYETVYHVVALSPMARAQLNLLKSKFDISSHDEIFITTASPREKWFPEKALLFIVGFLYPIRVYVKFTELALRENYTRAIAAAQKYGVPAKLLAAKILEVDERKLEEMLEKCQLSELEKHGLFIKEKLTFTPLGAALIEYRKIRPKILHAFLNSLQVSSSTPRHAK